TAPRARNCASTPSKRQRLSNVLDIARASSAGRRAPLRLLNSLLDSRFAPRSAADPRLVSRLLTRRDRTAHQTGHLDELHGKPGLLQRPQVLQPLQRLRPLPDERRTLVLRFVRQGSALVLEG